MESRRGGGRGTSSSSSASNPGEGAALPNGHMVKHPWEAPSVGRLAGRLGADPKVQPMMVEGTTGTVLAAVGEERDHKVAGEAISRAHQARLEKKLAHARGQGPPPTPMPPPDPAAVAFGAVYEHRDSFGKPMAIGDTDLVPEQRFALDYRQDARVQDLMQHRGGRSEVVWAGVGRGFVGPEEMRAAREAVAQDRSERLSVGKLSGPKPYSRHGY